MLVQTPLFASLFSLPVKGVFRSFPGRESHRSFSLSGTLVTLPTFRFLFPFPLVFSRGSSSPKFLLCSQFSSSESRVELLFFSIFWCFFLLAFSFSFAYPSFPFACTRDHFLVIVFFWLLSVSGSALFFLFFPFVPLCLSLSLWTGFLTVYLFFLSQFSFKVNQKWFFPCSFFSPFLIDFFSWSPLVGCAFLNLFSVVGFLQNFSPRGSLPAVFDLDPFFPLSVFFFCVLFFPPFLSRNPRSSLPSSC